MHLPLSLALVALFCLLAASRKWIWPKAALLTLLLLALSAWWLIDRLSGDGIDAAALYHLHSGLEGAGIGDFARPILIFAALALLSFSPLALARLRRPGSRAHGGAVFAGFLAAFAIAVSISPLARDALRLYRASRPVDAGRVAAEYAVPDKPLRRRRNIVWIYGESLERTYLDPKAFPGLMPNLSRLANQGLDFRGIVSAEGGGWTIAGLVSSMCGVPLTTATGDENSMGRMDRFLPGAYCLGDYLKQQGYATEFSGGADAGFAAKGRFLASHGFDTVKDLHYFRDKGVGAGHFSEWGVHDDVLLDDAFDDFMKLSAAGRPFLLATLTMDTHHPAGHLPLSCRDIRYDGSPYGDINLLRALKCSDRLVSGLVEKIRRSPYAGDTVIVIGSDHLAMPNDLSGVLAKLHRENLLLFLGTGLPPRHVDRPGSTLDSGATLLQVLDPDEDELGFGRSLLATAARPSASAAALAAGGARYPLYLGFARQLWTGAETKTLRMDDDQVVVGTQRITPPVLLEYDTGWNIKSIVLEDAPRQFVRSKPDNILAYVDRCTAFRDGSAGGEWCALVVDRNDDLKLYADAQLQQGVQVDAPLDASGEPRPRPRRPLTVAMETRRIHAGQYQVRLRPEKLPNHSFWLEAVSPDGKVIHAREWVRVDPNARDRRQIRLPVWLDKAVDQLVIRAWLDYTEDMKVDRVAMVRDRSRRGGS